MIDKEVHELLYIDAYSFFPIHKNDIARGSLCVGDEPIKKKQKPAKRNNHTKAIGPRVSFRDVATRWFVYKGVSYCVQSAPVAILREAVYEMVHDEWAHVLLKQEYLDIVERWYVICEARELKLHKSRYEAEKGL